MSNINTIIQQIEELGETTKTVSGITKNLKDIFAEINEEEKQEIMKKLTIRRIKYTEKQKANLKNINYFIAGIKCKTEDEIEKIFKERKVETKKEKKEAKAERKREEKQEDERQKQAKTKAKEENKKKEREDDEKQKQAKAKAKAKEEDEKKKKEEDERQKQAKAKAKEEDEKKKKEKDKKTPDEDKIKQSEEKLKKMKEEQEQTEEKMKEEIKTISIADFLKLTYIPNNVFDFIEKERKDIFNTYYEVMEENGKVLTGEDGKPIYDTKP
jgi:hypothetical protein